MRPFLTPWGLQEEKCVYWEVYVGLKCVRMSRIPWLWNLLTQYILTWDWNKFLFFSGRLRSSSQLSPKIIVRANFRTKSTNLLLRWDTHTRSIDLLALESAHSVIEVKDSQMKPETPNASHTTPHFWREMQMATLQARQVDLSRLRRSRSAALRPKKLAPLAKRSTCSKSKFFICSKFQKTNNQIINYMRYWSV